LSNSSKFLLVGLYFQHIIFRPHWPIRLAVIVLGAMASVKFLVIENMLRIMVNTRWWHSW